MDEPWEVAYGFIGQEPQVIQCFNEAEADALSFELQRLYFAGSSNWKISAYPANRKPLEP